MNKFVERLKELFWIRLEWPEPVADADAATELSEDEQSDFIRFTTLRPITVMTLLGMKEVILPKGTYILEMASNPYGQSEGWGVIRSVGAGAAFSCWEDVLNSGYISDKDPGQYKE